MTCSRHYTPAVIAEMQRIAATIEAERRHQYRAEMAQELRERLGDELSGWGDSVFASGVYTGIRVAVEVIDELSPPVVCDSETK